MGPLYECLDGHIVLTGYAPDGDSIRFLPNDSAPLANLQRSSLIRWSPVSGSVQLRLEGVDAPELHYAAAGQPRGASARDALLGWLGVTDVRCGPDGTTIDAAAPALVPATILTGAADAHGRVIAYLLRACPSTGARRHRVTPAVLKQTANHVLLAAGHVYPLAYTSQPREHRDMFRATARKARAKRLGVWSDDATARGFDLRGARSVGPQGALIFPKLFRRCIDYFADRVQGFDGSFVDWLSGHGSGGETRPDRVVLRHAANVLLSSLVQQRERHVALTTDLLDLVWVET